MSVLHTHLIAYTARTTDGLVHGIARVPTEHFRPSWQECAEHIPGYLTDEDIDFAPLYVLRYRTDRGTSEEALDFDGVQRVGRVVMRLADRGKAWDVQVLDCDDVDITANFPVFCV